MFAIIKNEFEYNFKHLVLITLMSISYAICMTLHLNFLDDERLVSRVVWPLMIGFGPVIYIASLSAAAIYSGRQMKFVLLPISLRKISIARLFLAVTPLLFVFILLVISNELFFDKLQSLTDRIFYSSGVYFLLFAFLAIGYDLLYVIINLHTKYIKAIGLAMIIFFAALIFYTDSILFPIMDQTNIGILYFSLGLLLIQIDVYLFVKRKYFLK
jgi:hypothetical protein